MTTIRFESHLRHTVTAALVAYPLAPARTVYGVDRPAYADREEACIAIVAADTPTGPRPTRAVSECQRQRETLAQASRNGKLRCIAFIASDRVDRYIKT